MELATLSPVKTTPPTEDPKRAAAEKLHAALFADMLRHGGLSEAFSTGHGSLDAMTSALVDQVAAELAAKDQGFTDHLYQALRQA